MLLYVLIEPDYEKSPWCRDILWGLERETSEKRISIHRSSKLEDLQNYLPTELSIIIIGSSFSWLSAIIADCYPLPYPVIILSNQPYHSFSSKYSYICGDIKDSMLSVISYLQGNQKNHIALYGINPNSLSDFEKTDNFLAVSTSKKKDVYFNEGSLSLCFDRFYPNLNQYDAIICANDYAAVSLIQKLKLNNFSQLNNFFIISYGDTMLAKYYSPAITTISANYKDFGKAVVAVHKTLYKNPSFSSMNITVKWQINIRDTTSCIDNFAEFASIHPVKAGAQNDTFYHDTEINEMLKLENLLSSCDEIDFAILSGLSQNMTYSQLEERHFLSYNGIKYRIRKMCSICGISSKRDLLDFLKKYNILYLITT